MVNLVDLGASKRILGRDKPDYGEIIDFIKRHGRQVFLGTDEELENALDEFAKQKRLMLLRDKKGRLIGVAACNNINSEFKDDINGKVLYVHGIVVHSALRHCKVMSVMLKNWMILFPYTKYIMFKRDEKDGKVKVMSIEKIL